MNWGIRITVLYLGFVALIMSLVFLSMNQKMDLETNEYYEKELHYQDRINTIDRTQALEEPLSWEIDQQTLALQFPSLMRGKTTSGSIYFLRPSDAALDKTFKLPADTALGRNIPLESLRKGVYKLQIDWEADGEQYYNEGTIRIQ
jgi:hypothetical protein